MSRGPETTFIGSVHRHLPESVYRMKNHNEYNSGIADCWYDARRDLWVEYKFLVVPKRDTTVIDLVSGKDPVISALQQKWLRDRHENGRHVGVIVGSKDGGVWLPGTDWSDAFTAQRFRESLLSRRELASLICNFIGAPM